MTEKYKDNEIIEINGLKYQYSGFYQRLSLKTENENIPNILCPICHNSKFWISYGEYKCVANCECGHHMTIYDG